MSQHESSPATNALLAISLVIVASAVLVLAGLPLDMKSQILFASFIFFISIIIGLFKSERSKYLLVILTLIVSTRYIWWRATETLVFHDTFSAVAGYALFAAEVYAYCVLLMGYLQSIQPLKRQPQPLPDNPNHWPTVDVFIPTYNEPLDVVAVTIAGALNLEYPRSKLNIYLLDDGNRPQFRQYAAQAGIHYLSRTSNKGAKAGNINEALRKTRGELIAIFDCDQIPVRSFLQFTVGWFIKDRKLAQLQTPQYFYTPDPIEKNLTLTGVVPNESSLFYGLLQDGNDLWDASFFCGSCAVLRRSALVDIGGIAEETVTEDAHTSLKLHRKGYRSAYLNHVQSAGLATESLSAHINQRIRWARGLAQIFRLENPLLASGLSLAQRLCYANATMHFLYAAPRLVFLSAPLFFLLFDLSIIQAEAAMVAAMALPHLLQNGLTAARMGGHWRHSFWAEVYETVLSFHIFLPTLVALIFPSKGKFNVTAKGKGNTENYFNYAIAWPILILGLLNIMSIVLSMIKLSGESSADINTTILNLVWASYNAIIIGVALGVAREVKQSRRSQRHELSVPVTLLSVTGRRVSATITNLSTGGAKVLLDDTFQPASTSLPEEQFESMAFRSGRGLASIPIKTLHSEPDLLRVTFSNMGPTQLQQIVRVLYSPADSWQDARESFKDIGVLRSLIRVVGLGIYGWWLTLSGLFLRKSRNADSVQPVSEKRSLATTTWLLLILVISSIGTLLPEPASAQSTTDGITYELRDLTDMVERPIELGTVRYGLDIPFAIRRDTVVNFGELILTMSWENLDKEAARYLQVSINDKAMWTADVNAAEIQQVRIPFDGAMLSDYNVLSLTLYSSDQQECSIVSEDPFTVVLHQDSRIEMDTTSIPIANDLDTLPLPFFDERDPRRAIIDFLISESASPATLKAAGRTASWFGALASYRGVQFRVSTTNLPEDNAVVIAAAGDLPQQLRWLDAGEPRVLLMDNPVSAAHQLLVITAPTDGELRIAVDRLLSSVNSTHASTFTLSTRQAGSADRLRPARWVDTTQKVLLADVLSDEGELEVINNNFTPIEIPFNAPGDFHAGNGNPHELSLDYFYAPNFTDFEEQLYVSINGVDLRQIDLESYSTSSLISRLAGASSGRGEFAGNLKIHVPHELIKPVNTVEIRFNAPVEISSNCNDAGIVQVKAGIGNTSYLDLSNGALRGRYPDLSLFVNSGLPFTEYADLRKTHIELPDKPASYHYALYLNLMGRFTAITGNEPSEVSVARGLSAEDRLHNIVITKTAEKTRIDDALTSSSIGLSQNGLNVRFDRVGNLYSALTDWVNPLSVTQHLAALARSTDADRSGFMISAESAQQNKGVVLLIAADTDVAASALQEALTNPERIAEVRGNAVVAEDIKITAIDTGRNFTTGNLPGYLAMKWWLSENMLATLLIIVLLCLLFAYSMPLLLRRIALRRLS